MSMIAGVRYGAWGEGVEPYGIVPLVYFSRAFYAIFQQNNLKIRFINICDHINFSARIYTKLKIKKDHGTF